MFENLNLFKLKNRKLNKINTFLLIIKRLKIHTSLIFVLFDILFLKTYICIKRNKWKLFILKILRE